MHKPLPKPLNNHLLVELERDYADIIRHETDEALQKGKVIATNFNRHHMTGMGGYAITDNETEYKQITDELDYLKGKTVYWGAGSEAGAILNIDQGKYALVAWWKLIGFEEDTPEPSTDPAEATIVEAEKA